MTLRKAHGNGAAVLTRVETLPVDELPPLNARDTEHALAERKRVGRPFERGNTAARGRKPALATRAGLQLDAKDPEYKKALKLAQRYRAQRVRELSVMHGGSLSAGVCSLLTSEALDTAASRYIAGLAAKSGDVNLHLVASRLAQSARQHALTALELASREAAVRPRGESKAAELRREAHAAAAAVVEEDDDGLL